MWTPAARAQLARDAHPYATGLTDPEWALVAPVLPAPAFTGRPRCWPMRTILDAILYGRRTGGRGGIFRASSRPGEPCIAGSCACRGRARWSGSRTLSPWRIASGPGMGPR